MDQKPPPIPPQNKKVRCPKCEHIQILRPICENCGFDIRKYARDLKEKREKKAELSQKQPEKPPISTPQPVPPPSTPPQPSSTPDAKTAFKLPVAAVPIEADLSGIKELFEKTWELYKRRFVTLLLILLASFFIALLSLGIPIGTGFAISLLLPSLRGIFIAVGGVLSVVSLSIILGWGTTAFIFAAADETLDVTASLKKGGGKLWSFTWLASIVGFVVIGGHLLFLIPGVIFSVWFAFSAYVFAVEDKRGMLTSVFGALSSGTSIKDLPALIMSWTQKTEPKQIDIVLTEAPEAGYVGQTSLGIYAIGEGAEGEELRLCAQQPGKAERPSSFVPTSETSCLNLKQTGNTAS